MPVWENVEAFSDTYLARYFLAALDRQLTPDGIEAKPDDLRICLLPFQRTIFMSLVIMISCVLLGYPFAYLLSNLPMRTFNLLLILVLLPFMIRPLYSVIRTIPPSRMRAAKPLGATNWTASVGSTSRNRSRASVRAAYSSSCSPSAH